MEPVKPVATGLLLALLTAHAAHNPCLYTEKVVLIEIIFPLFWC